MVVGIAVAGALSISGNRSPPSPGGTGGRPGFVKVEVTDRGFSPSSVTLAPGIPTELEFLRTTDETCASSVVFPDLGVSEPLALNQPVRVKVPASERRTLSFQCGIGDHRSAVIIQ